MCANFATLRDFIMSLSGDKQADIIDAFNTISRYLDDILNIKMLIICQYGKSNIPYLIHKPRFWTRPFLMILFLPKLTINVTTLILKLSILHF